MNAKINYTDIGKTYQNLNNEDINHFELMGNEIVNSRNQI